MKIPNWLDKTLACRPEPGKLYRHSVKHDAWCRTLKTRDAALCNCDPDVQMIEVDTLEEAMVPEPDQVCGGIGIIRWPPEAQHG